MLGTAPFGPAPSAPQPDSFSKMSRVDSSSSGSKYSRSDVSKSVDTVSGLLFAMIAPYPAARSACAAFTDA